MKNLLTITLFTALTLSGCATTNTPSQTSQAAIAFKNVHPKHYKLNNINIHLVSQVNKEGFLTKENIQKTYVDNLNQQLKLQNKSANNPNEEVALVDVDVTHKRIFMGEGLKFIAGDHIIGGYADTVFTYKINVIYQGVIIETHTTKDVIYYKGGIVGNFKKIARDLSSQGNAQNELDDVQKATADIINHLKS